MAGYVAFPVKNKLGEGPVFDAVTDCLYWCDIIGQTVLAGDTQTGLIKTFGFGEPVSAVFLTDTDRLLIAGASGLYQLNPKTGERGLILPVEKDNPITRANDSRVAPGNTIWFGTMGRKLEAGAGAVYHIKNGNCTTLFSPVSIPNATCFSPDSRTAYFCDTTQQKIMQVAIDPTTGQPIASPRLFTDLSAEDLNPDGAVIDVEGNLWNAQWGAGRVACYNPDGHFIKAVGLPATQLTCPCFGGPDLKTLYVTSANEGLSGEQKQEQQLAGAVFALQMEVAELPERRLSGS